MRRPPNSPQGQAGFFRYGQPLHILLRHRRRQLFQFPPSQKRQLLRCQQIANARQIPPDGPVGKLCRRRPRNGRRPQQEPVVKRRVRQGYAHNSSQKAQIGRVGGVGVHQQRAAPAQQFGYPNRHQRRPVARRIPPAHPDATFQLADPLPGAAQFLAQSPQGHDPFVGRQALPAGYNAVVPGCQLGQHGIHAVRRPGLHRRFPPFPIRKIGQDCPENLLKRRRQRHNMGQGKAINPRRPGVGDQAQLPAIVHKLRRRRRPSPRGAQVVQAGQQRPFLGPALLKAGQVPVESGPPEKQLPFRQKALRPPFRPRDADKPAIPDEILAQLRQIPRPGGRRGRYFRKGKDPVPAGGRIPQS